MSENPEEQDSGHSLGVMLAALGPFAFGYFLAYLFRAVNAIIEHDLVAEIGLGPSELGLVTASYLGAFALFQLPLGVLLDRFGPRRIQSVLVAIAGIGALIFAAANDVATLIIGRALIGLGFAGGLMAGFKSVMLWISPPRRTLGNSLVMSAGALGLLVATAPMEIVTQVIGWRQAFVCLSGITFAAALIIFLVVPERNNHNAPQSIWLQIGELRGIFSDRAFLALMPMLASMAGFNMAIQTLWAGPWLRDVAGLDRDGVAIYLMTMAIAFFIGVLSTGAIADRLVQSGIGILIIMKAFLALYLAAQIGIIMGVTNELMPLIWLIFGMFGQATILAYPWLAAHFGASRSARAQTAANFITFSTAFAVQFGIGAIIALFPGTPAGGYDASSYQVAFGAMFCVQVLAVGWYFLNYKLFH